MPRDLLEEAPVSSGPKDLLAEMPEGKTFLGMKVKQLTPEAHAAAQDMMKRGWGSGIAPAAYDLGGKVTDLTGSPLAGYIANVLTQAGPALLSGYNVGGEIAPVLQVPAKKLMQSAVKPSIADLESGAADKAVQTMLQEGINPTRAGMEKASKLTKALDQQVSAQIANSNASVRVPDVTSRLTDLMRKYEMQVNPNADTNAVQNVWTEFLTNPLISGKPSIPVQLAQDLKKGTYQALGGKSYGEVGSAATEAQKGLARGLREEISNAVPSIVEPLKREAALMNVKDVAGNRALMEANKNPLGLAALRMDNPLAATSFLADRWAALKALLARSLYTGSMPNVYTPVGLAGAQAMQNLPQQGALYDAFK